MDADQINHHAAWQAAVQIEPRLTALERLADQATGHGLEDVERWLLPLGRLMAATPRLAAYRRGVFAYLLTAHNAAIEREAVVR